MTVTCVGHKYRQARCIASLQVVTLAVVKLKPTKSLSKYHQNQLIKLYRYKYIA